MAKFILTLEDDKEKAGAIKLVTEFIDSIVNLQNIEFEKLTSAERLAFHIIHILNKDIEFDSPTCCNADTDNGACNKESCACSDEGGTKNASELI